jgi:hypothetical protein
MAPVLPLLAQIDPSTLILVVVGVAFILCIFLAKYANIWLQARMTSADVSLLELVRMTLRNVNPNIIVRSKIMAYQAGLSEKDGITTRALESHYLAGGNVPNVVRALIAANRADIPLSYEQVTAMDLAGRDVLEVVQTSVNPKVIPSPDPGEFESLAFLIGEIGRTVSPLQPTGKARFHHLVIDVASRDGYIEPDCLVEVVGIEVIVKKV